MKDKHGVASTEFPTNFRSCIQNINACISVKVLFLKKSIFFLILSDEKLQFRAFEITKKHRNLPPSLLIP